MVERVVITPENLLKAIEMLDFADKDLSGNIVEWDPEYIIIDRGGQIENVTMWQMVMTEIPRKLLKLGINTTPPHPMDINGYCSELFRRYTKFKNKSK